MLSLTPTVFGNFSRRVILSNSWRYLIVIAVCVIYALILSMTGPKWYRAEATLAFKNRSEREQLNLMRLSSNPLPIILEETPIEQNYELSNIIYSINLADRVIGDRLDELYDPEEYDSLTDFYEKFLLQLGYDYDGELNIVKLSYTYKDPELAAEFCNGFASALEEFMNEAVERTNVTPHLRARLVEAKKEARVAEDEVNRIAELYDIPDLLHAPGEWVKAYARALERSYISQAEMSAIQGALSQISENRRQRDLLSEPPGVPDTTITRDLILAALRFRLAMINAASELAEESLAPGSFNRERFEIESQNISDYLAEQYKLGLDVETESLLLKLEEHIVKNYLYSKRAETTYARLEQLPRLEAEIRPAIRRANIANATVAFLDRISSLIEIGEEYGIHPIKIIDTAIVPDRPIQPILGTLMYLVPTMLFIATLWFALVARMTGEAEPESVPETVREPAKKPDEDIFDQEETEE